MFSSVPRGNLGSTLQFFFFFFSSLDFNVSFLIFIFKILCGKKSNICVGHFAETAIMAELKLGFSELFC